VTDPAEVEDFYFSDAKLGAKFLEITVDGKATSIEQGSGYIVGVEVARLADGGGTHYIPTAVFLTPLTKGTLTVRSGRNSRAPPFLHHIFLSLKFHTQ
jgi:hypothetical protein